MTIELALMNIREEFQNSDDSDEAFANEEFK